MFVHFLCKLNSLIFDFVLKNQDTEHSLMVLYWGCILGTLLKHDDLFPFIMCSSWKQNTCCLKKLAVKLFSVQLQSSSLKRWAALVLTLKCPYFIDFIYKLFIYYKLRFFESIAIAFQNIDRDKRERSHLTPDWVVGLPNDSHQTDAGIPWTVLGMQMGQIDM